MAHLQVHGAFARGEPRGHGHRHGLGAPRRFIFQVVDALSQMTGLSVARAENLVEATQNADVFAEVSGILKACAVNLLKISSDLRLLSSAPRPG